MNQEIPDGWNKVKFKELAKQKSVRIDNPGESGFEKYVGLEHLDSGELVVKRYGSTSDVTSTMKLFNKGNILFARRNTYLKRVSVAPFDGVCSGDIIILEPILDHIVDGFLPIFMQFEPFENRIIALSAGAFSKRIKWKQLAEEDIYIPSIEEQKKIVEVLWAIEKNTEKNECLKNALELLKEELLQELLTKGIGHQKFKNTEIGDMPDDWSTSKFKNVLLDGSKNGIYKKTQFHGSGTKIVNMGELFANPKLYSIPMKRIELTDDEIKRFSLNKFDLIFARRSLVAEGAGKCSIVCELNEPTVFESSIIRARPDLKKVDSFFLYYFFNSKHGLYFLNEIRRQVAVAGITGKDLMNLLIPLPSLQEQKKITNILTQQDLYIANQCRNIEKLHLLKKKLTNDYLSGKLIIPKEVL